MPHPKSILPDPLRPPTIDEIERARSMYAEKFTVARCLAAGNMSLGTFYYWLDGGPRDEKGQPQLPPIPRRRQVIGKRRKPLTPDLVSLTARLTRTLAREALDIEQRLARPCGATPERERNVRMLTQLVQSVRVLATLAPDGAAEAGAREKAAEEVRDIDEFRETLARRIGMFVDERERRQQEMAGETAGE
jgi:hypothetical protein